MTAIMVEPQAGTGQSPAAVTTRRPGDKTPAIKPENLGRWNAPRRSMEVEAQLLRALAGGTQAMRDMGQALLPGDWREKIRPDIYAERLNRTFLFPAYTDAISLIAARPFQKSVKLKNAEQLSPELQKLNENCDRNGMDLTSFARSQMLTLTDRGLATWLVDMPSAPKTIPTGQKDSEGQPILREPTLADADLLDLRPYFVKVHPDNLVDWAWRRDAGGRELLAFIQVFDETSRVDPITGDEKTVQRIRYWSDTEWQVWERVVQVPTPQPNVSVTGQDLATRARMAWDRAVNQPNGAQSYVLMAGAAHNLGEIPLVTVNVNPFGIDRLAARGPLIDLAWENVAHWQSGSQQSLILHYARAPLLQGKAVDQTYVDGSTPIALGAGATILSRDPNFEMSYVEPKGGSIEAGERDLKALEDKMSRMGMQPLITVENSPKTATGVAADELRTQAKAQAWTEALEWGLQRAYELAARWLNQELPKDFKVELFRDIGLMSRTQFDLDAIDKGRARGDIPLREYWSALMERGTLPRDFDMDAAEELLAEEQAQKLQQFTAQAEVSASLAAPNANAPPQPPQKKPKAEAA